MSTPSGKAELRREALSARRSPEPDADRTARCRHLVALARLLDVGQVTAYLALPGEPDPGDAVRHWLDRGVRVQLPVLLADRDLAFADATGPRRSGRFGLTEPAGTADRHGIGVAGLLVVPALAVDRAGVRLGRGGGSYDRALTRAAPGAVVVAALRDGELVERLPAEAHDARVHAAVLPAGVVWFAAPGGTPPDHEGHRLWDAGSQRAPGRPE